MGESNQDWRAVGRIERGRFAAARRHAHWAAQVLSAAGDAALPAATDDSHSNAHWDPRSASVVGRALPGGHRVALSIPDLAIEWRDSTGRSVARFELENETLDGALEWTGARLSEALGRKIVPRRRDYDMPEHPVGEGAAFVDIDREALGELAAWYANADSALTSLARREPRATEVAIWPHHFDLGGIIYLSDDGPPEKRPQIGFGFTPGDGGITEPYFYLTPWPVSPGRARDALPAGEWIDLPFAGAVLRAGRLPPEAAAQARTVREFLASGLAASEALPGA